MKIQYTKFLGHLLSVKYNRVSRVHFRAEYAVNSFITNPGLGRITSGHKWGDDVYRVMRTENHHRTPPWTSSSPVSFIRQHASSCNSAQGHPYTNRQQLSRTIISSTPHTTPYQPGSVSHCSDITVNLVLLLVRELFLVQHEHIRELERCDKAQQCCSILPCIAESCSTRYIDPEQRLLTILQVASRVSLS